MADTLPRNEVAASVAIYTDETVRVMLMSKSPWELWATYLPLLVKPVLSSPNQYQFLSSELALRKIAPPCACIRVPEVSVKLILG
jgi:hypothetical protein